MKQLLIFFFLVFCLFSCGSDCEYTVDLKDVKAESKIVRLEHELFNSKSPEDIKKFIKDHPLIVDRYMAPNNKDAPEFHRGLYGFYTDKDVVEFYKEGEKLNNGFKEVESSIADFYKHIKYYYPSYHIPEVNTIVTGLQNTDFYMEDSLVVISLDYFYGKGSRHRPDEFAYMLERRESEFVVPGLAMRIALAQFVERDDKDDRLIADMVNWGKVHYFMERMMPCVKDSTIIMYNSVQMEEVENNMVTIWGHFIENQLFYETKPDIKRRYVEEAPKVSVIGEKCPGRIGRYLGWQIVKEYMEKNPEVTLQELMKEKDAVKIFTLSKYKPKAK